MVTDYLLMPAQRTYSTGPCELNITFLVTLVTCFKCFMFSVNDESLYNVNHRLIKHIFKNVICGLVLIRSCNLSM